MNLDIAPGNVLSLSPALPGWEVRVVIDTLIRDFCPIAAWAVIAAENGSTAVEPLFLYEGRTYTPSRFLELFKTDREIKLQVRAPEGRAQ